MQCVTRTITAVLHSIICRHNTPPPPPAREGGRTGYTKEGGRLWEVQALQAGKHLKRVPRASPRLLR